MTTDSIENLVKESDSELERAVRVSASADASVVLARLLWAFDARRRGRETLALRETTRALARQQ